jgi:hypothetical protein
MEVQLPGGLSQDGLIQRNARFRPLTGRVEQTLIDSANNPSRPGYVSSVLSHVLESVGDRPADADLAASLCVVDRQYLMLRLAALIDGEQMWLKVECGHCESPFDVDLQRCDLPVKPAGAGYPLATLELGGDIVEVRIPTGEDQERIGDLPEDDAIRQLLRDCLCRVNGKPASETQADNLSAAEIEQIDEALDDVSPAVCDRLLVVCPECGREQYSELDHYAASSLNEYLFYDEVHGLASHYHWSEAEILDLPQHKRRRYLDLINRSGGQG